MYATEIPPLDWLAPLLKFSWRVLPYVKGKLAILCGTLLTVNMNEKENITILSITKRIRIINLSIKYTLQNAYIGSFCNFPASIAFVEVTRTTWHHELPRWDDLFAHVAATISLLKGNQKSRLNEIMLSFWIIY